MMRRVAGWTLVVAGLWAAAAPGSAETGPDDVEYFAFFSGWPADDHPLDQVPRFLAPEQRLRCSADELVTHRSKSLRYAARVHEAFVPRLEHFDAYLIERAVAHYGRTPRKLVHKGAFNCRSARGRRGRISEHALGNALDFQGLDFPPMRRADPAPPDMPRRLRRGFQLRVLRHWHPRGARDAYHAKFLHELAEDLRGRPDLFRGIVGPPRPRHRDHLHLDAAPWRYAMFGYDAP